MGIEGDIGNHHRNRALWITGKHRLSFGSSLVAVPDNVDTPRLGLKRVGQLADDDIQQHI